MKRVYVTQVRLLHLPQLGDQLVYSLTQDRQPAQLWK